MKMPRELINVLAMPPTLKIRPYRKGYPLHCEVPGVYATAQRRKKMKPLRFPKKDGFYWFNDNDHRGVTIVRIGKQEFQTRRELESELCT